MADKKENALEDLQKWAKNSGFSDMLNIRDKGFDSVAARHPSWKFTCAACPVQAEGKLEDGRMWYFRSRWGSWSMRVSENPTDEVQDAVGGEWVASGDVGEGDFDGSWIEAEVAEKLIEQSLDKIK